MEVYRLIGRATSRLWRRGKNYSKSELRWLTRRRGLQLIAHGKEFQAVDRQNKVLATFHQIVQDELIDENERRLSKELRPMPSAAIRFTARASTNAPRESGGSRAAG